MFDFIFKRPVTTPAPQKAPDEAQQADSSVDTAAVREAALAHAESLAGNESEAAGFILQSDYADARFKAAQHVHSKPVLEQVVQAMRNTDRRVVKLMQKRLDAIAFQEKAERQAQECIGQAQRLREEPKLMPNQVADLDRAWVAIPDIAQPLRDAFEHARAALRERLEAQAALQRAVIDVRTKLQKLTRAATEASHVFTREKLLQSFESLDQEIAQYCAHPEAQTLPPHLLSEFDKQREQFRDTLAAVEKRNEAIEAREAALAEWETSSVAELKDDVLRRAWQVFPAVPDGDPALDARFAALLARIAEVRKPKARAPVSPAPAPAPGPDQRQHFIEALEQMEKALESGALQIAGDQDRILRSIDSTAFRPSETGAARLAKARSELYRLQGWARWGGNISREELLKAAEELPAKSLPVAELAKKVGSLRERWKSLDISAGPASKDLWERFDAACTTAYAPAAAHFRQLSDERHANLEKARSILADIRRFAVASRCEEGNPDEVDWKAVAAFLARTTQLWQRLGPIDRKEKKRVDGEFATAMRSLSGPLGAQREVEITRREKLIADASGLNPADRRSLDTLRALQERWQECAKSLPLERKDEQALWQRFRGACDAVFAKRKEAAHAADADRLSHLREKEAICAALEALENESPELIPKKMREAAEAWNRIGPVPRASEQKAEKRYHAALAALQKRMDDAERAAKDAQVSALRDKLGLCQALERSIADEPATDDSRLTQAQSEWQVLPELPSAWERALRARFDQAADAMQTGNSQHLALLQQNRTILEHELLRLEIMKGIESPAELSRERLKLQVEVLQSSLKTGQKPSSPQALLLRLCGLPAQTDAALGERIAKIADSVGYIRN